MPDQIIISFAEAIVRFVRDRAIQNCVVRLDSPPKSPIGKHWTKMLGSTDLEQVQNVIIPDCVDETIFCLLNAIDEGGLKLSFTAPNGQEVNLTAAGLGELAGWYMGAGNWRENFSKEKINHYLT